MFSHWLTQVSIFMFDFKRKSPHELIASQYHFIHIPDAITKDIDAKALLFHCFWHCHTMMWFRNAFGSLFPFLFVPDRIFKKNVFVTFHNHDGNPPNADVFALLIAMNVKFNFFSLFILIIIISLFLMFDYVLYLMGFTLSKLAVMFYRFSFANLHVCSVPYAKYVVYSVKSVTTKWLQM